MISELRINPTLRSGMSNVALSVHAALEAYEWETRRIKMADARRLAIFLAVAYSTLDDIRGRAIQMIQEQRAAEQPTN